MIRVASGLVIFVLSLLSLTGCNRGDTDAHATMKKAQRTILVYMLANNNLGESYHYDSRNITDMCNGLLNVDTQDYKLLVFYAGYDSEPYLIELSGSSEIKSTTIKWYDQATSTDSTTMLQVLQDVRTEAPAEEYGLIMWSHATNWLPDNRMYSKGRMAEPTSFGREGAQESTMNIDVMGKVLNRFHHSFILFDACLMGSAEVAYELRHACDYIIASPTETLGEGYPYKAIIPLLCAKNIDYVQVCECYHNSYIDTNNTVGGTITCVKTDKIEHVADCCHDIVSDKTDSIGKIETRILQYYDNRNPHLFYDLYDYMSQLGENYENECLQVAIDDAIVYKSASNAFFNIMIERYSGLSCYIPGCSGDSIIDNYYKKLQWSKRIYN